MANTKVRRKEKKRVKMLLSSGVKAARRSGQFFLVCATPQNSTGTDGLVLITFTNGLGRPKDLNRHVNRLANSISGKEWDGCLQGFLCPTVPYESVATIFHPYEMLCVIRNMGGGKPVGASFPKILSEMTKAGSSISRHTAKKSLSLLIEQGLVVKTIMGTYWDKGQFRQTMTNEGFSYLPTVRYKP